jgi:hypothetical protein
MLERELELGEVALLLVPVVPEVDPAVELEPVDPYALDDPPPVIAFVKMNDAPELDPDCERDAVVPDVEDPAVPDVPVALPESPRCRQPVTVIVPDWPDERALDDV